MTDDNSSIKNEGLCRPLFSVNPCQPYEGFGPLCLPIHFGCFPRGVKDPTTYIMGE